MARKLSALMISSFLKDGAFTAVERDVAFRN